MAFRDGKDVRLYKEPEPAHDSAWLRFVERRRLSCNLVISHIRHATKGGVSFSNTQPFARELGGRMHVFAHNGKLPGLAQASAGTAHRFLPIGETDSELAFCVLMEKMADVWNGACVPAPESRRTVFEAFAAEMRAFGPANILYSDGDVLFVHADRRTQSGGTIAPPGLWRLHRRCAVRGDALPDAGVSIADQGRAQQVTLFASVPLTKEAWTPLGQDQVLMVQNGCIVQADPGAARLEKGMALSA